MLSGQWRGHFFLLLLVKRAKLLAHDWSSDCLATAYAIERLMQQKFSIIMTSRLEVVDQQYIQELKEKSESESTKKSTEYWKNVFKKWANEINLQPNLEDYQTDFLDRTPSQFYVELRKEIWQ